MFKLFNIFILIIFAINFALAYFFIDILVTQEKNMQLIVLFCLFLIESLIIIILIKEFYYNPISELKLLIQKFYV